MERIKLIFAIGCLSLTLLSGCGLSARHGGKDTINLSPGTKLESINWAGDSLWILTRDIRGDEFPETYTYSQHNKTIGFKGEVVIIESEK